MKINNMLELTSSQNTRSDRRQFSRNCVDFVQSTNEFFEALKNFIYDVETKEKHVKQNKREKEYKSLNFYEKCLVILSVILSEIFLPHTTHDSTLEKNQDDGLTPTLRKRLMKLKVDLDRLRSTASLLQEYYKTNNLTVDDELRLRLFFNHFSEKEENFLLKILSADNSNFYNILVDYICSKLNHPMIDAFLALLLTRTDDQHLENVSLLFKDTLQKVQEYSFDPSQFVNEVKSTSVFSQVLSKSDENTEKKLKKGLDELKLETYSYNIQREDALVDAFYGEKPTIKRTIKRASL